MPAYRVFVLSAPDDKIEGTHTISAIPIRKLSAVQQNICKTTTWLKSGRTRE